MEQRTRPEIRGPVAPAGAVEDRCRVAEGLLDRGEIERARAVLSSVLETDLNHTAALVLMARIGLIDGCLEEARQILEHVLVGEPGHAMARAVLAEIESEEMTPWGGFTTPSVYVALGGIDRAFEVLEQGFEIHSPWVPWAGVEVLYEPLRGDPRLEDLLARTG